jgi:hypothetical protein
VSASIVGVTSDDIVVFNTYVPLDDGGALNPLEVIPLGGGTVTTLIANQTSGSPAVYGPDVLYYDGNGGLFVWSAGNTLTKVGSNTQGYVYTANAAGDFWYFDNLRNLVDGGTGLTAVKDLYVAKKDGTGVTPLVPTGYRESCVFYGAWAGNDLVAQYCLSEITDGGTPGAQPPTMSVFSNLFSGSGGTGFTKTTLPSLLTPSVGALGFNVSADGTTLYAALNSDKAETLTTSLAANQAFGAGTSPGGSAAFLGSSDTSLVYQSGSSLISVANAGTTPTLSTILASGVSGFYDTSPDGAYVEYFSVGTAGASDLWIAGTSGPSSGFEVAAAPADDAGAPTASAISASTGSADFTADSQHLLFYSTTGADPTYGIPYGTLMTAPVGVTSAGEVVQISTNVEQVFAATGSKVVYCDNFNTTTYSCDIEVVDLAVSTTPTLIAATTNGCTLSRDGKSIIYGTYNAALPGVWVVPVP